MATPKKRKLSAESRKRIADAQKRRWEVRRTKSGYAATYNPDAGAALGENKEIPPLQAAFSRIQGLEESLTLRSNDVDELNRILIRERHYHLLRAEELTEELRRRGFTF